MINLDDMSGVRVYQKNELNHIGEVKDIIVDVKEGKVEYFKIDYRKVFHSIRYIQFANIIAIHKDRVVINSVDFLNEKISFLDLVEYSNIKEIEVYDESGNLIGFLNDVYIKKDDGSIIAYIISNGFIDDITNGLMVIRDIDKFSMDKGFLKLNTGLEKCTIDIKGGLKNLLEL